MHACWSKHIESLRKDVECTFGILKKRFIFLKNCIRLHHMEDIEHVFRCCCILHNILLNWDGYDDWRGKETEQETEQELMDEGDIAD